MMHKRAVTILILFFLLSSFSDSAFTGEKPLTYDRINLSVTAGENVQNDIIYAVVYSQKEGSHAQQLTEEVNQNITFGVEQAKKTEGIKVQTLDYRTSPVYDRQILKGWRVRQSMRVESRDAARLSLLLDRLQKKLSIESIAYKISPEKRQAAEDRLISEAIVLFKKRAESITKQFGRSDYRLVHMDVGTSGPITRTPQMRAMAMEKAAAPPTLEPGTQTIRINISATIELQIK